MPRLTGLYLTNNDFKTYVDKYSENRRIPVEEALTHAIVFLYAEWLFLEW